MKFCLALATAVLFGTQAGAALNDTSPVPATPEAVYAVLFDQQGTDAAVPICAVDTADRADLVPASLQPRRSQDLDLKLNLPRCSNEQQNIIGVMADKGNPNQVAALPAFVGSLCAINFVASAAIVVAANMSANRTIHDNASGFAIGAGTGAGVARGIDLASKVGMGAVGFICSSAGVYVGYLVMPSRR